MEEKHQIYKELSKTIKDGAGLQSLPKEISSADFISSFIKSSVEEKKVNDGLERQLQTQVMLLDAPHKEEKKLTPLLPPGCRRLNAKQKRKLKLFQVPKEEQKYNLYLPLHSLWVQYMEELLQVNNNSSSSTSSNTSTLNQKVLKADFHGCSLTVCQSKCKSYVGLHGIVIQETQNTFKLICKDDKIRTIPKTNSLFSFTIGRILFTLRGTHLKYRPGDRSARKFKEKPLTVKDLQY